MGGGNMMGMMNMMGQMREMLEHCNKMMQNMGLERPSDQWPTDKRPQKNGETASSGRRSPHGEPAAGPLSQ